MITTDKLVHKIKEANDVEEFIHANHNAFTSKKLSEHLLALMIEKNVNKSDVVKLSNLSLNYVYQIFNGRRNPTRDKVIMLAFGFKLDLTETDRLLKVANIHSLYAKDKRDSIILYSLHNKTNVLECNFELEKLNFNILE